MSDIQIPRAVRFFATIPLVLVACILSLWCTFWWTALLAWVTSIPQVGLDAFSIAIFAACMFVFSSWLGRR